MPSKKPIIQPPFDSRIVKLTYPLMGGRAPGHGTLKRGSMIWAQPLPGYSGLAKINFLYNPSVVEADYPIADSQAAAVLQFPNPGDKADLRVPLQQTASWSVLYDRTYELWGTYDSSGNPIHSIGKDGNNPAVIGVLADIIQFQQFTGMLVNFSQGTLAATPGVKSYATFDGHQGIIQIVPSHVFFGGKYNLSFYGYISEWNFQITHWTQFMVPMRCVIDITFTMLPPAQKTSNPNIISVNNPLFSKIQQISSVGAPTAGVGGR